MSEGGRKYTGLAVSYLLLVVSTFYVVAAYESGTEPSPLLRFEIVAVYLLAGYLMLRYEWGAGWKLLKRLFVASLCAVGVGVVLVVFFGDLYRETILYPLYLSTAGSVVYLFVLLFVGQVWQSVVELGTKPEYSES